MLFKKKANKWGPVIALGVISTLGCSSCTRDLGGDIYTEDSVNTAYTTKLAIVVDRKTIKIQEHDKLKNNDMGMLGGAATGAVAGSQLSKGQGSTATGVLGGVLGAVAGTMIEKKLNTQGAFEYVLQLEGDQELQTIIQGGAPIEIGQSVYLLEPKSGQGRSRIRPRSL